MTTDAPPTPPTSAPTSTMRRDIASAYLVTLARIGSWAAVSAIVFRLVGDAQFGILALVRATLGLLGYTTLGLAPAMIYHLARVRSEATPLPVEPASAAADAPVLDYAQGKYARRRAPRSLHIVYANGQIVAALSASAGLLLLHFYTKIFGQLHDVPEVPYIAPYMPVFVMAMGLGFVVRLASDGAGAVVQVASHIWIDNLLLAASELLWAGLVYLEFGRSADYSGFSVLPTVGSAFLLSNLFLAIARWSIAAFFTDWRTFSISLLDWPVLRSLLLFGLPVTAAQLADYLYAPIDYILINKLIGAEAVAIYVPAVQIDAGLLLLVTGLATVLLPKTALAHAAGDAAAVRRYYVRGTLASAAMLVVAAVAVWAVSPWLLRVWFGQPMPATVAILPLVLIHTVAGGSSAVGRSVLLGMGKVRPFTVSVLVAGVSNVVLSYCFVRYLDLGLRGIVLGTIVVVVARCLAWMPWYVLRSLRLAETGGNQTVRPGPRN